MKQCTNDLPLSLQGHAMFMINVMNPCWIYEQADLSGITGLEATVGRLPFIFQIGDDVRKIPVRPPRTPDGELEVHLDGCDGKLIADLPLGAAVKSDGISTLRSTVEPQQGPHDLCFFFTRPGIDPVWAIDAVQLLPAAN